jgi:hypothetical protein
MLQAKTQRTQRTQRTQLPDASVNRAFARTNTDELLRQHHGQGCRG